MIARLRAPLVKETRALLPVWAACMAAVLAAAVFPHGGMLVLGVLAYAFGSIALGAQAIGHEYSHRTLGQLLSQPTSRRRLLLIKFTVLAAMLLTLGAAAARAFFGDPHSLPSPWRDYPALLALPFLGGLVIAPWMTMVTRSALAGVMFTPSLICAPLFAGQVIGIVKYGFDQPEANAFAQISGTRSLLVLLAAGVVLTWHSFMRLEALEGAGRALALPRWLQRPKRARTQHRLWLLAKKELHLQHMTFVVACLNILGWAVLTTLKHTVPQFADFPVVPVTLVYMVLLSLLIGSLASAEERQLGTLEWQTLLPMAAWQQWVVKVGMAWALALVFTIAVPVVLDSLIPSPERFDFDRVWLLVIALTTLSLYVSSLSTSGLRAMVTALPVAIVGFALVWWIVFINSLPHPALWRRAPAVRPIVDAWTAILAIGLVWMVLRFAFVNHRSTERGGWRTAGQLIKITAFVIVGSVLSAALFAAIYLGIEPVR